MKLKNEAYNYNIYQRYNRARHFDYLTTLLIENVNERDPSVLLISLLETRWNFDRGNFHLRTEAFAAI
jgi:hypothetical protein